MPNKFEAFPRPGNNIEEEAKPKKQNSKLGRWARKNAALAAVASVGFFGGMHEGMAADNSKTETNTRPKIENLEKVSRTVESTDSFDVIYKDSQSTWGVEYVPKRNKDQEGYLAQRYVKIDNKSGKTIVLGEYDNIFQAAEGVSKIADVPEQVRSHAQRDAAILQTEQDFQKSGFTEPTGNPAGKTHIEERTFKGYNVEAKNKVEVDEQGKVVRLVDSELESEE